MGLARGESGPQVIGSPDCSERLDLVSLYQPSPPPNTLLQQPHQMAITYTHRILVTVILAHSLSCTCTHTHTQTHTHTHTHNLHHTRQCSNDSQSAAQPLHPHYSIFIVYLLHWLSYSAIQLCVSLAFTFRFAFRLVDSWADVPTCYN